MSKPWLRTCAVFLMLLLATAGVSAQWSQGPPAARADKSTVDRAAMERSWHIQEQLAAIERDRDGFIDTLLASWASILDPLVYDLERELRPIMERATPLRLYGASLVGDFETMTDVLMGVQSAGKFINALSEPQPKAPTVMSGLGDTASQLVFTPIAPCRVVDTRGSGSRTGVMAVGTERAFDLTTSGLAKGQGGAASCPGLPSFSHKAWSVNVTVTGYGAFGWLNAWGYNGTEQSSSIINYSAGTSAIANGLTLTGCYDCSDDIVVKASSAPTHVIIDVVGYYQKATGFLFPESLLMTGVGVAVNANDYQRIDGGGCPTGTILVGGTQWNTGFGQILTSEHGVSGNAWYEKVKSIASSTTFSVWVNSICLEVR